MDILFEYLKCSVRENCYVAFCNQVNNFFFLFSYSFILHFTVWNAYDKENSFHKWRKIKNSTVDIM